MALVLRADRKMFYGVKGSSSEVTYTRMKGFTSLTESKKLPDLSTEECVKSELLTPRAIRRMSYEDESGQTVQDYYIAFRIHKINPSKADMMIV